MVSLTVPAIRASFRRAGSGVSPDRIRADAFRKKGYDEGVSVDAAPGDGVSVGKGSAGGNGATHQLERVAVTTVRVR